MTQPKVILITGCNSPTGIGFATTHCLAEHNHIVYATTRNQERSKDLQSSIKGKENIFIKYLDVTDEEMIIKVVKEIIAEQGKIDVLVNNAGYGLFGTVEQVTIEQAKREYDVNVFGAIRLIQEVLPHMRRARNGHIINVSSIFCASNSLPFVGFYIGTKAALEKISEALAIEVAPWNIKITNFQPGPVATGLSKEYGERLNKNEDPYEDIKNIFPDIRNWLSNEVCKYESPQETAEALCDIISRPEPHLIEQSNAQTRAFVAKRRKDITGDQDLKFFKEILLCKH